MNPFPTPDDIYGDPFPQRPRSFLLLQGGRLSKVNLAEIIPWIDQADPE